MPTDLEQQSLARVAILEARRKRRWKRVLFWALLAVVCFGLQAGAAVMLVDLHWALILSLYCGVILSIIASARRKK